MTIHNHTKYGFLISAAILMLSSGLRAEDCPVKITVTPTKVVYASGEPVEVRVTFHNQGPFDRGVVTGYPDMGGGLRFEAVVPLSVRTYETNDVLIFQVIPGLQEVSSRVYLQRFLDGFVPGVYDIPWQLHLACTDRFRSAFDGSTEAKGKLKIEVARKGPDKELREVFEEYERRWRTLDQQEMTEAREAMTVATSPLVKPFLENMWKNGWRDQAAEGLKKLSNEPSVRSLLSDSAQSNDPGEVLRALKLLDFWGENLTERAAKKILEKAELPGRVILLQFIGKKKDQGYLELVESYLSDQEEAVAEAARGARSRLLQGGKNK